MTINVRVLDLIDIIPNPRGGGPNKLPKTKLKSHLEVYIFFILRSSGPIYYI